MKKDEEEGRRENHKKTNIPSGEVDDRCLLPLLHTPKDISTPMEVPIESNSQ